MLCTLTLSMSLDALDVSGHLVLVSSCSIWPLPDLLVKGALQEIYNQ